MAYTMVRADRSATLAPLHEQLPARQNDSLGDMPTSHLEIVLKGGFLKYLEAVERPEVAIFARASVRDPQMPEERLVWEKIYLASENPDEQIVINKATFLPRINIPLLPGIVFDDQEIYVSLRIIELDQDDNERVKRLVNTAAGAVAAFKPEAAVAASAFQTALAFVTAANSDDIEFQFDFGLIPNEGSIQLVDCDADGARLDLVLQPRLGDYVVLKTEHRQRMHLPNSHLGVALESVQWLLGTVIKLATFNIANWRWWEDFGADRDDDFYMQIVGRPFEIPFEGWQLPEISAGRLSIPENGGRLYLRGDRLEYRDGGVSRTFVDQSYLVLSLIEPREGVDLDVLRAANEAKESINTVLRTGQIQADEIEALAEQAIDRIVAAHDGGAVRDQLDAALDAATTPAQIQAAYDASVQRVDQLEVTDRAKHELRQMLRRRAARRHRDLGGDGDVLGPRLATTVVFGTATGATLTAELQVLHPVGASVTVRDAAEGTVSTTSVGPLAFTTVRQQLPTNTDTAHRPLQGELVVELDDVLHRLGYWVLPPALDATLEAGTPGQLNPTTSLASIPAGATLRFSIADAVDGQSPFASAGGLTIDGNELASTIDDQGRLLAEMPNPAIDGEIRMSGPRGGFTLRIGGQAP